MKNEKFLVEWIQHLSNRPLVFFLVWGGIVVFFLYLFWGLQKSRDKRYFKEEKHTPPSGKTIQVREEKKTDLAEKE